MTRFRITCTVRWCSASFFFCCYQGHLFQYYRQCGNVPFFLAHVLSVSSSEPNQRKSLSPSNLKFGRLQQTLMTRMISNIPPTGNAIGNVNNDNSTVNATVLRGACKEQVPSLPLLLFTASSFAKEGLPIQSFCLYTLILRHTLHIDLDLERRCQRKVYQETS